MMYNKKKRNRKTGGRNRQLYIIGSMHSDLVCRQSRYLGVYASDVGRIRPKVKHMRDGGDGAIGKRESGTKASQHEGQASRARSG